MDGVLDATLTQAAIRLERVSGCPLCRNDGRVFYDGVRDTILAAPGTWTYRACDRCRLLWLDPRPTPEDLWKVYAQYFTHADSTIPARQRIGWRERVKRGVLRQWFGYGRTPAGLPDAAGWLLGAVPPVREAVGMSVMWLNGRRPGRLLDVGCGNGRFVLWMQELGWDGTGVEPDAEAAEVGRRQYGAPIVTGQLHEARFPDASFDAITLHHVIEHVHDPLGVLQECRRILRPGGRVVLVTPNYRSAGHRLFGPSWLSLEVPRHLVLFSRGSLAACAERAGLSVLQTRTVTRWLGWMWASSLLIRWRGRLPTPWPRGVRVPLLAAGLLAQGLAAAARPIWPEIGDELVLVATTASAP